MNIRQDIEFLRILSAFGIVWYHSGVVGHDVSYASLIVFLVLSMYLAGRSSSLGRDRSSHRVERLLIPWAVWFFIYGILNLLTHNPFLSLDNGVVAGVLSGSQTHLWFMPFIFLCLVLFDISIKYASKLTHAWVGAVLAVVLLSSTSYWRVESLQYGSPYAQYIHSLSAIFIGVFLAFYSELPSKTGAFLLAAVIVSAISAIPFNGVGVPYLIGVAAAVALLFKVFDKLLSSVDFRPLSQCTLGIYFVHIFFLMVLYRVNISSGIILPIMAFLLSAVTIFSLRRLFPSLAKYWI